MIGLEEVLTYRVTTTGPLETTEGSPWGPRQYWEVSEATLSGERITAKLAMPGGDWMAVSDDGAVILMRYTGLVEQSDAFKAAATEDRETSWDDQYMRLAITFETGDERYRWLNEGLFVARGRLLGTGRIEYTVYRVG